MLSLIFPPIDPILVEIGPLAVRWYALAYLAGFALGWWKCMRLARAFGSQATAQDYDDFMSWAVVGTILGGRIGYVLFYQFEYYLAVPMEALKIWHGGMSFHGGVIGVGVAAWLFVRRRKLRLLAFTDILACVTPIGLGLGRLANFINGELFGRPTDVPWGFVFPRGGDLPRHPSQLYEAALEGVLLYFVLAFLSRLPFVRQREGFLTGSFLGLYGLFRFIVEFYRQPDPQLGFLYAGATMGQLLCLPMIALGCFFIWSGGRKKHD